MTNNFFASNLKYLRQRNNIEQLELAERLGRKSPSSISEWEKGRYTPKAGVLSDIAKILWDQSQKDAENLDFELENDDYLFKVVVNSVSGSFSNSSARLDYFTGFILVKKK